MDEPERLIPRMCCYGSRALSDSNRISRFYLNARTCMVRYDRNDNINDSIFYEPVCIHGHVGSTGKPRYQHGTIVTSPFRMNCHHIAKHEMGK